MSLTLKGLAVVLLGYLVSSMNLPVASEAIETTVSTVAVIVGAVMAWWGRYRHGDITWYGASKY
jgi:hypothetical protein